PLVSRSKSGSRVDVVISSAPCAVPFSLASVGRAHTYTPADGRILAGAAPAAPRPAAVHLLWRALGGQRRGMALPHRAAAGGHPRRRRRAMVTTNAPAVPAATRPTSVPASGTFTSAEQSAPVVRLGPLTWLMKSGRLLGSGRPVSGLFCCVSPLAISTQP